MPIARWTEAIVARFRANCASVLELHQVGRALDLLIGCAGIDQRVEIKDGDKPPSRRKLTPGEEDAIDEWRGRTPVVVETIDDVDALCTSLYRQAGRVVLWR